MFWQQAAQSIIAPLFWNGELQDIFSSKQQEITPSRRTLHQQQKAGRVHQVHNSKHATEEKEKCTRYA
jgi:hypothetical protein